MKRKTDVVLASTMKIVSDTVEKINVCQKDVESSFLTIGRLVHKAVENQPEKTKQEIFKMISQSPELKVSHNMVHRAYYTLDKFRELLVTSPKASISTYEIAARSGSRLGIGVLNQIMYKAIDQKMSIRQVRKEITEAKAELRPERTKLEALLYECHKALKRVDKIDMAKEILEQINKRLPEEESKERKK